MNIGIIGTGHIGTGLGKHWAGKGHKVFFGSRHPEGAMDVVASIGSNASLGTIEQAVEFGDLILLAIPWAAAQDTVRLISSWSGKTLIDCTNPISCGSDGPALAVDSNVTSAAEEIAKLAPGAQVVKAFNTTYAQLIRSGGKFGTQQANVFFCGDDEAAKSQVAQLAEDVGFEPIDIGNLRMARFLEPFTIILIQLQRQPGMSSDMGYRLMHR